MWISGAALLCARSSGSPSSPGSGASIRNQGCTGFIKKIEGAVHVGTAPFHVRDPIGSVEDEEAPKLVFLREGGHRDDLVAHFNDGIGLGNDHLLAARDCGD